MRAALVGAVVAGACHAPAPVLRSTAPEAGLAIALYRQGSVSFGVVDDRRYVDVAGDHVLLANVDPGASLASLVIETPGSDLRVGPCTRKRLGDAPIDDTNRPRVAARRVKLPGPMRRPPPPPAPEPIITRRVSFAPVVECAVHGAPGRYLVRIAYVSESLSYRVQHEIAVTDPAHVTLDSRFAIVTPPWRTDAHVVMFDGVPGGVRPPHEIARGTITLDGGTSMLVAPTRQVPASLRYVSEQSAEADTNAWSVWATLELPGITLAPGPVHVHVATGGEDRWVAVQAPLTVDADDTVAEPLRLALWPEPSLVGDRNRVVVEDDGEHYYVEQFRINVKNTGELPRDVLVIEHAHKAKQRRIENARPSKPFTRGDAVMSKITLEPGRSAHIEYAIVYGN